MRRPWRMPATMRGSIISGGAGSDQSPPRRFFRARLRENTTSSDLTFVEGNASALADARYNARVNHIGRCRFRSESAEAFFPGAASGEYDLVLMGPPPPRPCQ